MFFARPQQGRKGKRGKSRFSGGVIGGRSRSWKRNVGRVERIMSVASGAGLIADGIRRLNWIGLGEGLAGLGLLYRGATGKCVLYRQLSIDTAGAGGDGARYFERGIHVEESVTVERPVEEVHAFWRNLENLPRFMDHLESVRVIDKERSHWVVKAPAGTSVEWDARIINENDNQVIAWESLPGADVDNKGSVRFRSAPRGQGTIVKVTLDYIPPAGRFGAGIARLFGENPEQQLRDDLGKFRQIMETGDVPMPEGQPPGRLGQHKATKAGNTKAGALAAAAGSDHDRFQSMPSPNKGRASEEEQ